MMEEVIQIRKKENIDKNDWVLKNSETMKDKGKFECRYLRPHQILLKILKTTFELGQENLSDKSQNVYNIKMVKRFRFTKTS
jgi:hypothetical protein